MSGRSCRRLWEVEAARDGRLSGAALASFLEHASRCTDCSREHQALEELAAALARSSTSTDEVAHRRAREELLERAAAGSYGMGSTSRWWRLLVAAAAALVLLSAIALGLHRSHDAATYVAEVAPSPGARWSRQILKGAEQLTLSDGALTLTVRRAADAHHVSLRVPDGVIEDIGTVFRVTVRGGRTMEILVTEGAVVFRRPGAPPLLVSSPSTWAPPEEPPRPQARPPEPPNAHADVAPTPQSTSAARSTAPRRPSNQSVPSAFPADEDFAYLRIVALRREGRTDEARLAAAEYLRSFPHGFRRVEVLAFVRAPH
jgi:hypothetical protein